MSTVFAARRRIPLIAGLAAFLLLVSSGTAWSYWTTRASAAGSVTTDAVAVSQAGFASPPTMKYLPSGPYVSTRSFTVTNGGAISGTATVSISSSEQYAANLPISVWRLASGACTDATPVPTSGVTAGSWASAETTLSLNAGATATLCVRTRIPDWKTITDPSGGRIFTPQLDVSLDAQGWVATTPMAAHTQRTAGMYPLTTNFFATGLSPWHTIRSNAANGICLDVSGSGGVNADVISWSCHQDSNQRWQFLPVNGEDQSFVTLRPRHAPTTRLTYTTAGLKVAAGVSSDAQRWHVQNSGSFFQLVSAADGMCLGMNTTSGNTAMMVVECDQAAARLTFQREPLTMTTQGSDVILRFGSTISTRGMLLQKKSGSSGWIDVESVSTGSSSVSFDRSQISNSSTTEFRIVFASSTDVAYGNIMLRRSGNGVEVAGGIG